MLSAKDKFGRNAVIMAQNGDMLRLLLSFVLPSEGVDLLTAEDTVRCWTALHFFAARGSIDCFEAALEYVRAGAIADPKVSIEGCLNRAGSSSGDTVLHAAVCGIAICPDLLRILIQNGASPFCVNKIGDTALHCCIKLGLPLCMKAILDSVSKDTAWKLCNQKNNNGITPLCLCVRSSLDADVADELCTLALFYGAQPSDASDDGSPPLADACAIIGYTNVVRVLLDHGANVDCFVRACPSSPKLSTVRRRSSDSDTQSDVSTGEYDQVTLTVLQIALAAHAVDTAVLLLARKASATRRDALEFAIHHLHHAEAINSSTSGAAAAVFERILNQHGQPGHSKYLHAALYSHAPAATISLLLRSAHDEVAMFAGVDFLGHNALHVAILANNAEGLKFVLQKARSNMLLEQMLSQKAQYANERMSGMVFPAFDEGVSLSVLHYAGLSTCPEIYALIEDAIFSCPALCTSASIGNMWRDDDGNTPLHYAAAVGNGSMCLRMMHTIARLRSDYPDVRMENDTDPVNSKGVSVGLLLLSHLQTYDLMHRFYVMGASLLHWCIVFGGSVDLIEDLCRLVRSRPMTVNASSQIENGSAPSSAYDPDATENDIVTNEDAHSSDEELPSLAADERSGSSVVIRAASTPLCIFDTSRPLLAVDHRGRTLLHQCVCAPCDDDRLAIVRFLLTRAPSMVNTPDGDGRSPVFYVADVRYLELICDRWSDALTVKDDDLVSFGVSLAMAENVNVELLSFVIHFLCKMASRSASSVAVSAVRELRQIACVAASFNRVDILRILYERLGCSVFDPLYNAGIVDELTKNGLQDGTLKSADNEKEKEYVLGLPPLSLAIVTDARDALSFLLSVCPISYLFSGHQTALQLAAAYDCYEPFAAVMSVVERCRRLANVDWRRLLVLLLKGDSVGPIALALSRGIVLTTVTDSVVTMLRNCCAPDRRLDQLDSARVREKEREKEFKSFRSVSSTWDRSLRRTSSVGSNSSLSSGLQKSVAPLPSIDATSERGVSGWTNSKRDGNERVVTLEMEFLSGLPDFVGITDEQWVRLMMASVDPSPLVDAYFDFRESWKGDNAVMRVLHFAVRQASVKVAECLLTNARTRGQGWERRLCGFGTAWNVLFETAFVANADARDGLFQFFLDLLDSTNMTVERDLLDPKSAVSPLHVACYVGNAHAVEFMLSLLLTSRVTGDHPDLVEKLRWLLNLRTVNGVTIIHLVTLPAVLNTIRRVMVDVGMTEAELKSVFVDEADSLGLTLCHYSAMYNNVEVGNWLNAVCGSEGVDPLWSERDFAGVSATEYAQHHLGSREFYEKCVLLQ
jgi:ankyrin repeat protein